MKLYRELAKWWQLFSPVEEYADEAASFIKILQENCQSPCRTVLELGAGAGSNAFYLKKHFEMTLIDLSAEMLAESRAINAELEHLQGDMRFVRLNRGFDAVFIHDAICYMKSEDDLRQAIETAFFIANRAARQSSRRISCAKLLSLRLNMTDATAMTEGRCAG